MSVKRCSMVIRIMFFLISNSRRATFFLQFAEQLLFTGASQKIELLSQSCASSGFYNLLATDNLFLLKHACIRHFRCVGLSGEMD